MGFKIQGVGFRVQDSRFGVQVSGYPPPSPAADLSSYSGTVNAGSSPSTTLDTVEDSTEARMIMAVVRGGAFSEEEEGWRTVSMAKKQPATAALNPGCLLREWGGEGMRYGEWLEEEKKVVVFYSVFGSDFLCIITLLTICFIES